MVQVILDGWGAFAASPLVEADNPKLGRIVSLAVAALAKPPLASAYSCGACELDESVN
jgi:hypothetical protein